MSSEIRANLITSRAGLSTVTMTDSGPMFSGITTFVDNSGFTFGVGGGTSIFTPSTNVLTFGTNNTEKIRIDASGHMHGVGVITATHFYGDGSNLTGISGGISTDAYGNTYGGHLAGNALTSGNDDNVIIGREAGEALNSGDDNVFIGAHAGEAATSLSDSVLIGYKAGFEGQTGSRNVIIGNGNFAIYSNDELHKCTFVGYGAGSSMQNTYNEYNTYIGYQAGVFAGADYDVAIGREAGSRSTGRFGVFIGDKAGNESGSPSDVTGQENVMIGRSAGKVSTSGGDNTLVGSQCGATLTTGSNNLILGHDADVSGATVSNEITLGDANITKFRIPGLGYVNDAGKVGIGTDNPTYKLHVDSGDAAIGLWKSRRSSGSYIDYSVGANGAALGFIGAGGQILTGGADSGDFAIRSEGDLCFSSGGAAEKVRITSAGTVNIGSSNQTTHMLYLQSAGDAGIHIRADTDNSGENDNPYLSMSQDGAAAAQFQIGMNGDAGQHFTTSLANAAYIYASNSSSQPIQIAHMNNMCVNIAARKNEIALNDYSGNTIAGMEIHHYGNDTGAALKFSGHNNTGTPGLKTFTQLTHLGGDAKFMIHHMGDTAIQIGSTRRIDCPAVYGTAISSPMRDLYIESTGQMGYQPSIRASKINIADNNDVSWLYNLTPKTYYNRKRVSPDTNEWTNEAESDLQYGLIAEEVESVNSNICFYDVDESNNKTLAGVTYSQLITPILKAVQDLKSEIHSLQEENKALRIRVTNLEDN